MAIDPQKYSIYAQRSAEKEYVDWGKVARDVTTGITTIAAERQLRKDALDTLTTKAMENLSQTPDVNNQAASSLIITASDMSKQNLMIQTDLLKRGLITPKDYQLFMNQQKTGYASLSTAVKNWDGWYQKSREWLEPGEGLDGQTKASEFMIAGMTSLESFGNLNNKMLWTNPANGQLQLVEMGKDKNGDYTIMPDASKNPEKFLNPGVIGGRQNMEDRRKVLANEASYLVDKIAKTIIETDINGKITSVEDFKTQGIDGSGNFGTEDGKEMTYKDWLDGQVGALTATANESGQILMEQPGYEIAESIDDFCRKVVQKGGAPCSAAVLKGDKKDPRWIKVGYENNRMDILLTDDQKTKATELAKNAVELQIGQIIKKAGRDNKSEGQGTAEANVAGYFNDLKNTIGGNEDEFDASVTDLKARANERLKADNKRIEDISREKNFVEIEEIDNAGNKTLIIIDRYRKDVDGVYTDEKIPDAIVYQKLNTHLRPSGYKNSYEALYNDASAGGFSYDWEEGLYKGDETRRSELPYKNISHTLFEKQYTINPKNIDKPIPSSPILEEKLRNSEGMTYGKNLGALKNIVPTTLRDALDRDGIDIKSKDIIITGTDVPGSGKNQFTISITNPFDGKEERAEFIYRDALLSTNNVEKAMDVIMQRIYEASNRTKGKLNSKPSSNNDLGG